MWPRASADVGASENNDFEIGELSRNYPLAIEPSDTLSLPYSLGAINEDLQIQHDDYREILRPEHVSWASQHGDGSTMSSALTVGPSLSRFNSSLAFPTYPGELPVDSLAGNDTPLDTGWFDKDQFDNEIYLPRVLPPQSTHRTLGPEPPVAPIPTWCAPSIQGHQERSISDGACTKRTNEISERSVQFIPHNEEASVTKKRKREIKLADGKVCTVFEAFKHVMLTGTVSSRSRPIQRNRKATGKFDNVGTSVKCSGAL